MEYTEEEKRAINVLKYLLKRRYEDEIETYDLFVSIETTLNLLEKQQKEIEFKDKRIHYLENEARGIVEKEFHKAQVDLYKNYIPKKAIREKIDSYTRAIADSNDGNLKHDLRAKIKELKELLGE